MEKATTPLRLAIADIDTVTAQPIVVAGWITLCTYFNVTRYSSVISHDNSRRAAKLNEFRSRLSVRRRGDLSKVHLYTLPVENRNFSGKPQWSNVEDRGSCRQQPKFGTSNNNNSAAAAAAAKPWLAARAAAVVTWLSNTSQ